MKVNNWNEETLERLFEIKWNDWHLYYNKRSLVMYKLLKIKYEKKSTFFQKLHNNNSIKKENIHT